MDLNYDDPHRLSLLSHYTALEHLYFPETVLKADLIVSMPKLKTHHWAGVTLSMKNFFGVIPGSVYRLAQERATWGRHPGVDRLISAAQSLCRRLPSWTASWACEGNGPIQEMPRHVVS